MATVVSITNPITGAVEQVDKLDHTAQQIDDAVSIAPQLSNRNLLDNWYFANPVNQRGQTSYIGAGYGIDRWKSSNSNLSVNLTGDGIVLSSGSAAGYLAQYFDGGIPIEDSYTISALVEAITGTAYFQAIYSDGTYGKAMKLAAGLNVLTVKAAKTISRVLFQINAGSSVTIKAAKLELGSQQTLAHQDADGNLVLNEIPDYGEQLRRCQRYSKVYGSIPPNFGQPFFCAGFYRVDSGFVQLTMICPEFREIPVVSILDGDWALFDGENVYNIGEINLVAYMPGVATLGITSPGNSFSNGKILFLFANSGKIMLSADL